MQRNPDGSIVLAPGEQVPAGYQGVQQGADGSVYAVPAGGGQSRPSQSGSGAISAPVAYGAYQLAKPYLTSAPATPQVLSINGAAPVAASATTAAVPTVANAAIPVVEGGTTIIPSAGAAGAASSGLGAAINGPAIYAGGPNVAGAALGAAGIAAGAYGLHRQYGGRLQGSTMNQGLQGAASGAALGAGVGSVVPGLGTVVGGVVGGVAGGLAGLARGAFGHRKTAYELMQRGLYDAGGKVGLFYSPDGNEKGKQKAHMQLANGSYFNVEEGGAAVETIQDLPGSKQAIAWVGPLAEVLTEGGDDQGSNIYLAGTLANGVMAGTNGDMEAIRANVLKQMENTGLTEDVIKDGLSKLLQGGKIDQALYNQYIYELDTLIQGKQELYDTQTFSQFVNRDQAQTATQSPARGEGPAPLPSNSMNLGDQKTYPSILIPGPDGKPLTGDALLDALEKLNPEGGVAAGSLLPEGHRVALNSTPGTLYSTQNPDPEAVKSAAQMAAALASRRA